MGVLFRRAGMWDAARSAGLLLNNGLYLMKADRPLFWLGASFIIPRTSLHRTSLDRR